MGASYRDSHTRSGKAAEYDSHFRFRHRALLWSLEQRILSHIQKKYLGRRHYRYLDFACGTGRILSHLEKTAGASVGVDVSPEMLRECRTRTSRSSLIQADLTADRPFAAGSFQLITAFRFFLNAEDSLREAVMHELAGLLSDDGYLVFNNHMNRHSLIAIALRIYSAFRGRAVRTWTLKEIHALAERAQLSVVAVYHTGVIPGFENIMLAPRPICEALESTFSEIPFLRHIAQIQIIVCRRKRAAARMLPDARPDITEVAALIE